MKYIDQICRDNRIVYYIMGGTALGAIRHGGFIPWDDDLDIFMTPDQYEKFKTVFESQKTNEFVLQEWKTTQNYLEYAKVRMNGTTFIEECYKNRSDMHHGIYVDIMILHKVPESKFVQKKIYYYSKFVTLYGLTQRNWKPKTKAQAVVFHMVKALPCKSIVKMCYKAIYRYDSMEKSYKYCYWITPAKFRNGLFDAELFSEPVDISFEDTVLLGSRRIKEYLEYRYGDYMKLPPEESRQNHSSTGIIDLNKGYKNYT